MSDFQKASALFGHVIAERGFGYFQQGKVLNLEKSGNSWYAEVSGSYPYYVNLSLNKNGRIARYDCSCPFDGRCKHVAALYFALLEQTDLPSEQPLKTKPIQNDDELLLEELRDCFNRYAKGCDYWEVHRAAPLFASFLGDEPPCEDEEMSFKVLHTFYTRMNTLIQKSDDDGAFGDLMDECVDLQYQLYTQTQNAALKRKIENTWQKIIFDTDKHWIAESPRMPDYWQKAMCETNKAQKAMDWIEHNLAKEEKWGKSQWLVRKYEVLRYIDSKQAVDFLLKNTKEEQLRHYAVDLYLKQGETQKAKSLLIDGIKTSPYKSAELQWCKHLLEIAEKENNLSEMKQYAKELMLHNDANKLDSALFKKWQKAINADKFTQECEQLFQHKVLQSVESKYAHFAVLCQRFDLLKAKLLTSQDQNLIFNYVKRLADTEQYGVYQYLLGLLEKEVTNLKNRQEYAKWVKTLNRLLKNQPQLIAEVRVVIRKIREDNPRRPALLDEISAIRC